MTTDRQLTDEDIEQLKLKMLVVSSGPCTVTNASLFGPKKEEVNHPEHYGGKDNPYEAIKVIEAWKLNFRLGNCVKYISRNGKKSSDRLKDLQKALWYLQREITKIQEGEE